MSPAGLAALRRGKSAASDSPSFPMTKRTQNFDDERPECEDQRWLPEAFVDAARGFDTYSEEYTDHDE